MLLFVGLGNPGAQYARNRHNVGFMALDAIAERHGFSAWRKRFQGLAAEGMLAGEKVLALKPQTYMNNSGQAVGEAMRFFKLAPEAVTVLYDELDLAPGKLRVKKGGGAAGHNGIRSITAHIGAEFWRVRIGIGHPGHKDAVLGHALGDFAKVDQEWLEAMLDGIADHAPLLAEGDTGAFMSKVALRVRPPQDKAEKPAKPSEGKAGKSAAEPDRPTPPPLAGEADRSPKPKGALQAALARALGRRS